MFICVVYLFPFFITSEKYRFAANSQHKPSQQNKKDSDDIKCLNQVVQQELL